MRLVLVLLAALLLAPAPAHAQRGGSRNNPKELIKQAERLYDQKKYLEAAALLEKANESLSDSRIIYNIARAYDQAGKETEAISYYEKYLTDGEDAQLRKRSRSAIDRLRLQKEKEEKTAAAAEAERKRLKAEAEEAQRRAAAEREAARRAEEASQLRLRVANDEAQASRKRMQVTSLALGGVALASVGVGTFFGLQANGARGTFNSATELDSKLAARSATRSNALFADIGFGVGLVGAVAAILLYPKEPVRKPGKVRLTSAPQGTGAGMEVSF
jgi:tetratricopeptide (TPR) repeat protein